MGIAIVFILLLSILHFSNKGGLQKLEIMVKKNPIPLVIGLVVILTLVFSLPSLLKKNSSGSCNIKLREDISTHELFFQHVNRNEYCPVYTFYIDNLNQYGYTDLEEFYVVKDFTREEYTEMRKYANIQAYFENGNDNKYTLERVNQALE